jgi:hypothetical protein
MDRASIGIVPGGIQDEFKTSQSRKKIEKNPMFRMQKGDSCAGRGTFR